LKTKKNIAILGSTGSIGTQALEVVSAHRDAFGVEVLTAQNNASLLIEQAKKFKPNAVVIVNDDQYQFVKDALADEDIKVYAGENALSSVVQMET
jgi:1-deoxy-D-xylulose-5-phosphate reductoisomerase